MYLNHVTRTFRLAAPALLGLAAFTFSTSSVTAQIQLLAIEFNEDDKDGFDLWPGGIAGNLMTAQFGPITVDVSTNTSFAQPVDRGSVNGTPLGYTNQRLYEDLLHAFTPTGTCTLDFGGLRPSEPYTFTLYAWDPATTSGTHEWSVTQGSSVPSSATVDWSQPLLNNESFALVFEVTTTPQGTFQVDNTNGLQGSAINGFVLEGPGELGVSYCSPSVPNSGGAPGTISASGSSVVLDDDFTVTAASLPAGQFGIFLTSRTAAFIPGAGGGSNGNLCLGGTIGRFNLPAQILSTGSTGEFSLRVPLSQVPAGPQFVQVVAGETWNFQAWHRDGVGLGSNFTNGVEVLFN